MDIEQGATADDIRLAEAFVARMKPPPWATFRLRSVGPMSFAVLGLLNGTGVGASYEIGLMMLRDGGGARPEYVARWLVMSLYDEWAAGAYGRKRREH